MEILNRFIMKGPDGGPIIRGMLKTVRLIRSNTMQKIRLKGLFHVSYTRGGGDYTVRRVVRLKNSCEMLGITRGR